MIALCNYFNNISAVTIYYSIFAQRGRCQYKSCILFPVQGFLRIDLEIISEFVFICIKLAIYTPYLLLSFVTSSERKRERKKDAKKNIYI